MESGAQDTVSERGTTPEITISLCGDVMTGRGVDQILSRPGDPTLHEASVRDARYYVELAERSSGAIPKPVSDSYIWGAALGEWGRVLPDARIVNLETTVTSSDDYWPGKEVHYRMSPRNVACLARARLDCCILANNHVLDWGHAGLIETLQSLRAAGLNYAGAGMDRTAASAPLVLEIPQKGRLIVFAYGVVTSGIPASWAAEESTPGVNLLFGVSQHEVQGIRRDVARVKRENDVVVASLHWGPNWGYRIPEACRRFAHQLVDSAGVDVIHGHSSHHVLGIEVYRGHLILYGCGDFLDDYEGISGYEQFRGDLGLIYWAHVDPATGRLRRLWLTPTQIRRMRVECACCDDVAWLREVLCRESRTFGVVVESTDDITLELQWRQTIE